MGSSPIWGICPVSRPSLFYMPRRARNISSCERWERNGVKTGDTRLRSLPSLRLQPAVPPASLPSTASPSTTLNVS
eukprot:763877-Hanusia_phi.AAC.5